MGKLVSRIDAKFYPDQRDHWDDTLFRTEVLSELDSETRVLDLGAGAGRLPQMDFSNDARQVCGVDPDSAVLANPYLNEAHVSGGESIPHNDCSFDLVIANNVLEHLEDPARVFREVARVLVPGGLFLVKTSNRHHYVPLVARCTPHPFHVWLNRRRGRDPADTFPTFYRANSRRQITRHAAAAGLVVQSLMLCEGRPEYLRFAAPTYLLGLLYERLVNSTRALAPFRVLIVAALYKPLPS